MTDAFKHVNIIQTGQCLSYLRPRPNVRNISTQHAHIPTTAEYSFTHDDKHENEAMIPRGYVLSLFSTNVLA